jgi:tellurite resistance protein
MAPTIFGNVEHCARRLGVTVPIEIFCFQDAQMNAFVIPPEKDHLTIGVSSGLVERLDDGELRFVIGHEIGHALFDHMQLGPWLLDGEDALQIAPIHAMRLYAWMRYAELSADRVGLVCCGDFDTAVRAFFKLTSGLSDPRLVATCGESAAQYVALEAEAAERDPGDWFSTHPYNPLRVKALDLFARSTTFAELAGKSGAELSEKDLEEQVARLVQMMEPTYLHDDVACAPQTREFLALGAYLVASIDGKVDDRELELLSAIVGDDPDALATLEQLASQPEAELDGRLAQLAEILTVQLSPLRLQKVVEDLCAMAIADGHVADEEVEALSALSELLGVDPLFVEEALARPEHALD